MGLGIPVQADVTDLGGGNQIHQSIHHAQTGAENGHDGQFLACQHLAVGGANGSLHLHIHGGQIPGGLIAHQAGNFADQLPELLDGGVLVAHHSQLVVNQRVIHYMYISHNRVSFYFCSLSSLSRSAWDNLK